MDTGHLLVGLGIACALLALLLALIAARRGRARRAKADPSKPLPQVTFGAAPGLTQPLVVEVQNLGGLLASGAIVVQYGQDLYGGELALPEKAPPRQLSLRPLIKVWHASDRPRCLILAGRDARGRCWDCLDGGQVVTDSKSWVERRLRDVGLQGVVDFPALTAAAHR
jgi:hypothetical protein